MRGGATDAAALDGWRRWDNYARLAIGVYLLLRFYADRVPLNSQYMARFA
jgi:hypothetical protein